jgi:hypothetical protein
MSRLRTLTALFTCLASATAFAATPVQPKVVFVGDGFTSGWNMSANPNWVNQGSIDGGTAQEADARFQADVVNLHPAIVHIMVGSDDTEGASPDSQVGIPTLVPIYITSMVEQAKAADIKVILGTEPEGPINPNMTPLNAWIEAYGAANNIPVINYADALCDCVGSVGESLGITGYFYGTTPNPSGTYLPLLAPTYYYNAMTPTAAGYGLMTQLAQNTIATVSGVTLKSGHLQNIDISMYGEGWPDEPFSANANDVLAGSVLQFVPYGVYSDGSARTLTNTNFAGSSGTWTSSNPLVMVINQSGKSWAVSPGKTRISYRSPNGIGFSPWDMTVVTCIETGEC